MAGAQLPRLLSPGSLTSLFRQPSMLRSPQSQLCNFTPYSSFVTFEHRRKCIQLRHRRSGLNEKRLLGVPDVNVCGNHNYHSLLSNAGVFSSSVCMMCPAVKCLGAGIDVKVNFFSDEVFSRRFLSNEASGRWKIYGPTIRRGVEKTRQSGKGSLNSQNKVQKQVKVTAAHNAYNTEAVQNLPVKKSSKKESRPVVTAANSAKLETQTVEIIKPFKGSKALAKKKQPLMKKIERKEKSLDTVGYGEANIKFSNESPGKDDAGQTSQLKLEKIPRKKKQPAAKKRSSKEKIFTVDSDVMSMTKSDCHAANNSTKEASLKTLSQSKNETSRTKVQTKKLHTVDSDVMSNTKSDCHAANNSTKEIPLEKESLKTLSQSKNETSRTKVQTKKLHTVVNGQEKLFAGEGGRSSPVGVAVSDPSQGQQQALKSLYPPSGKSVIVVESLTKAKVIQNYLGEMFEVIPSNGHVRDLAGRSGSVRPDDDFSMVWEVPASAWTHLKSIKVALSGAKNLILASDPDREGEAIAWHIIEMLRQQDTLPKGIHVARVVFHEITEASLKSALQSPRRIDTDLVHAYLARRALDYLIGFNISPLLWRKLPGCQSAGRVQSAALGLLCDQELEVEDFEPQEYWTVDAEFYKEGGECHDDFVPVLSQLTHLNSKKLEKLSIQSCDEAQSIREAIMSSQFEVLDCRKNQLHQSSPTPYITSSLQQDAANKLQFSAAYTMKLAQKLYEGVKLSDVETTGLITYMRTDGFHMSEEAVKNIQMLIVERYGENYVATKSKHYKKVKNAQEAHEAIRPTNIARLPSTLAGVLDGDSLKLYTLIWSRTVACRMASAFINQVHVSMVNPDGIILGSGASNIGFLGYRAVYKDRETASISECETEETTRVEAFKSLSTLQAGDLLALRKVEINQHQTRPPPRYSEGALIKKLEELGIGRPSTYSTIIKVLKDRKYVTVKNRVLTPEFRGRMVSAFLSDHFSEISDYSFTADMENELDNVSVGRTEWKGLLKDYWARFSKYCERASKVDGRQVEKMLEERFGDFLFASLPGRCRTCPSCMEGILTFKVSRFGAGYFIGCNQHPKCKYIARTIYNGCDDDDPDPQKPDTYFEPKLLGLSPTNERVFVKNGPYGFYVQLGDDKKGRIPKRAPLNLGKDVDSVTLDDALELLRYPVTLGNHPEDDLPVILKVSRSGFIIRHRRSIASVPKSLDPHKVTLEKALKFLSSKDTRQVGRPKNKVKVEDVLDAMFT